MTSQTTSSVNRLATASLSPRLMASTMRSATARGSLDVSVTTPVLIDRLLYLWLVNRTHCSCYATGPLREAAQPIDHDGVELVGLLVLRPVATAGDDVLLEVGDVGLHAVGQRRRQDDV